jgi:hypothetical protein
MTYFKWVIAIVVLLGLGVARGQDEQKLTSEQQKLLKKFQGTLEVLPVTPNVADEHLEKVRGSFRDFLASTKQPAHPSMDVLAGSLFRGVNGGQVTTAQSVGLTKAVFNVLSQPSVGYSDVNRLVNSIDPVVQSTGLSPTEKMRLYREVLVTVQTAPNYAPDAR